MITHTSNLRAVASVVDFGDIFLGTALADSLTGGLQDDILIGLNGDDQLVGDAGRDSLFGGAGNDVIYGGAGADLIYGGTGNDQIFGGLGIDTVNFADEPGGVWAELGAGPIIGPQPDDQFSGVENAIGGTGNDTLGGSDSANTLSGAGGADLLTGGLGRDRMFGGTGGDTLYGGANNDVMLGGEGADFLYGGQGADVMRGGGGIDQFVFGLSSDLGANDRIVDFQVGIDKFVLSEVGGGGNPAVAFSTLLNGNTLVTVGDAGAPLFEIEVFTLRGTMSISDVLFV